MRILTRNTLLFTIAIAIATAQSQPANYLRTACIKVHPGKSPEFMQFAHGTGPKVVQALVDSGAISASTLLRGVVPAGDEALCDFLQVDAFNGEPTAPLSMEQIATVLQKSGTGMTPEQFFAKRESLAHLVSTEIWRSRISIGEIRKGDYLFINRMKVHDMAEYRKLEENTWKPMAEQWIKDGLMQAWRMSTLVLPAGTEAKYQATSVDIFPTWKAAFSALPYEETFKKIHAGKDFQQTWNSIPKIRDLARREMFVVEERIGASTKVSQR